MSLAGCPVSRASYCCRRDAVLWRPPPEYHASSPSPPSPTHFALQMSSHASHHRIQDGHLSTSQGTLSSDSAFGSVTRRDRPCLPGQDVCCVDPWLLCQMVLRYPDLPMHRSGLALSSAFSDVDCVGSTVLYSFCPGHHTGAFDRDDTRDVTVSLHRIWTDHEIDHIVDRIAGVHHRRRSHSF